MSVSEDLPTVVFDALDGKINRATQGCSMQRHNDTTQSSRFTPVKRWESLENRQTYIKTEQLAKLNSVPPHSSLLQWL